MRNGRTRHRPAEYPDKEVNGIFILDDKYAKNIGENIVDVLNLREDIIDFEITPNRPDCLSIEGLEEKQQCL